MSALVLRLSSLILMAREVEAVVEEVEVTSQQPPLLHLKSFLTMEEEGEEEEEERIMVVEEATARRGQVELLSSE